MGPNDLDQGISDQGFGTKDLEFRIQSQSVLVPIIFEKILSIRLWDPGFEIQSLGS